jgi:hypothetical protein
VEFKIAPMLGGVFGRTNGIAPGCEVSVRYCKKVEASISNEYVFDTRTKLRNFYYAWPQLTYSPVDWFHVGAVAQRIAAYHTLLSIQRVLVGVSHNRWELITCVFDPGSTAVILVLEWGVTFCGVYLLLTIPAPRKGQKLMVTPSLPQESPDFSSARRTLHQLVRRAHLSGSTLEQMDRRATLLSSPRCL